MNKLIAFILITVAAASFTAFAQAPPKPPVNGAGEIEVDPINCWLRTDKTAIQVGERFGLTVTCGVIETDRNKVVVDPNQLEPTAVSLAPFEIVSGVRHEDVVDLPWRYFQYEYAVRLIGNNFGQDVDLPPVNIKYTIQSSIGDNEGREQTYVLPALPMRIVSLVPTKASDIRDVSRETFADMEARRRRASEELVAAAVAFGFATVLLGLAFAKAIGQFRKRRPAASRALSPATLLGASLRAVRRLKADVARDGWTPERAARGLALFRVAAAVALGRTVAQAPADRDAPVREGQVPLRKGIFRRKHVLISAATSADAIERQLAATTQGQPSGALATALEQIRESLHAFSTTRYGRSGELDTAALDAALENGAGAIRRVRLMNIWPMRMKQPWLRPLRTSER